jgi:hypothetical protein
MFLSCCSEVPSLLSVSPSERAANVQQQQCVLPGLKLPPGSGRKLELTFFLSLEAMTFRTYT